MKFNLTFEVHLSFMDITLIAKFGMKLPSVFGSENT